MNVVGVTDVDGDYHACVLERQGLTLRITHIRPEAFGRGVPIRDLHEEKRKVALAPGIAPVADHGLKQARIEWSAIRAAVGFALVPDYAANGERSQRRDHAVIQSGRRPRGEVGMPLSRRQRFALCLSLFDRLFELFILLP